MAQESTRIQETIFLAQEDGEASQLVVNAANGKEFLKLLFMMLARCFRRWVQ